MSRKTYRLHVLSHTHWDREWYQEFQGFRQRLVFQMDSLFDLLEKQPGYRCFHLDGQTICLEDYLEIRPEARERLTRHLQTGRILIGPWYVMPDELLLSGESLVRNLIFGHRICRDFGVPPMPVGYVSDIFGHCSQFPQMVRGFGMDTVFLHRGTSNADAASELLWEGADGSEVLVIKAYPHTGYNDFLAYRTADDESILDYIAKKQSYARTPILFALEGNDHTPAFSDTLDCIARWNFLLSDTEVIHSSMTDYLCELKESLGNPSRAGLIRYKGELRTTKKSGMYAELMTGTASSRVNLKQRNDELEWQLARCAEYLHAISFALGGDSQKPFLDLAWRYLIKNHPHDSICGCSLDQVHRDMIYRFGQAKAIARNSIGESVHAIGDRLDTASLGESYAVVTVYNTSTAPIGPVLIFSFEILRETLEEKRKEGLAPALFDESGNSVYFEVEEIETHAWPWPQVKKIHGDSPSFFRIENAYLPHHRFHVNAVGSLPPLGYHSWAIRFVPEEQAATTQPPSHIKPVTSNPKTRTIANEFLELHVREDGLIDVHDRVTGVWYRRLHDIEDCGDRGDGWNHVYPTSDRTLRASDPDAKRHLAISIEQNGLLSASATVSFEMRVPADLAEGRNSRSRKTVAIPVTTKFTITAGLRRVDCETTVENTARNHRMRVLFPTERKAAYWYGDSAFDLVQRHIRLPDTTGWEEQAREETPVKIITAVQDDRGGLAIITKGLCESCVQDVAPRTIALTLFRGFAQQIGDGWTQDSQMLGRLVFQYSIAPYSTRRGRPPVPLMQEVDRYKLPAVSLTFPAHQGDLPPSGQFVNLPEGLCLSTVKMSEDGRSIVLRLFNTCESRITGDVRLSLPLSSVSRCDLLERPVESLPVNDGAFVASLAPKEIATYLLFLEG